MTSTDHKPITTTRTRRARASYQVALTALTGSILALSASAAVYTQTVTLPGGNVYTGHASSSPNTNVTQSFAFNKFDITTGVLSSVTFSYSFAGNATFSGSGGGGGGMSGIFGFNGTPSNNAATNAVVNAGITPSGGFSGSTNLTASTASASPITFTAPLSTYEGTGTYSFDWLATTVFSGSPGTFMDSVNLTGATVTATYTYAPVPEPATTLFGLGLLGALGLRRRRAARATA